MKRKVVGIALFCLLLLGATFAGYWDMLNSEQMRIARERTAEAFGEITALVDPSRREDVPAPSVAPAAPTSTAAAPPSDSVAPSFDILRVEPDGSTVLAGKAAPGSAVRLIDGSTLLGEETAGPAGDFAVVFDRPLAVGDHQIRIEATGPDGGTATSRETAIVSVPSRGRENELLALVESPDKPSRLISVPKGEAPASSGPVTGMPPPVSDAGPPGPVADPAAQAGSTGPASGTLEPTPPQSTAAATAPAVAAVDTPPSPSAAPAQAPTPDAAPGAAPAPDAASVAAQATDAAAPGDVPAPGVAPSATAQTAPSGTESESAIAAAPVVPAEPSAAAQPAPADPAAATPGAVPASPDIEIASQVPDAVATATPGPLAKSPPTRSTNLVAPNLLAVEAVEIEDETIYIAGRAPVGPTIRVYVDNIFLAEDAGRTTDRFLVTTRATVTPGEHMVRADQVGADGSVLARVEVPFLKPEGRSMSAVAGSTPPASAETAAADAASAPAPPSTGAAGGVVPPAASVPMPGDPAPVAAPRTTAPPASPAPPADVATAGAPTGQGVPGTASDAPPAPARAPSDGTAAGSPVPEDPPAVAGAPAAAPPAEAAGRTPDPMVPKAAAPDDGAPPSSEPATAPIAPPSGVASSNSAPSGASSPGAGDSEVAATRQAPLQAAGARVIIRRGDTLWRISRDTYGRGARYTVIYLANGDQIRDPNRIYPGQVFSMPEKDDADRTTAQ